MLIVDDIRTGQLVNATPALTSAPVAIAVANHERTDTKEQSSCGTCNITLSGTTEQHWHERATSAARLALYVVLTL